MRKCWMPLVTAIVVELSTGAVWGQNSLWDPGKELPKWIAGESEGKLKLSFESRFRFEGRENGSFGKDPDRNYGLFRNRLSLSYTPVKWLRFSGMVQDSRAPSYGNGAPNSLRDTADLQESYIELFPDAKHGFSLTAGRTMLSYGEGRLIGTPQWANVARTYDNARVSYKAGRARIELLMVSPVKVQPLAFNDPNLGERIWGVYSTMPEFTGKSTLEVYVLRHDQNRIGGFTGGTTAAATDRLGTNTFGARMVGPLAGAWKYSVEGDLQNGTIGTASQGAAAWFSGVSRRWQWKKHPFDLSGEYKFASGTTDPKDPAHSGTFDQISPANHDKFGHEDLFGWRNIHNLRSVATFGVTKMFALNLMYDNYWLVSKSDALYSGPGRPIMRSATGTAGRHVGQEVDAFVTWKSGPYLFGGGYGYFFNGEVIRNLTPNASPIYAYVFSSYSF